LLKKGEKGVRVAVYAYETTDNWRCLDTPAENAVYSTGFFSTLLERVIPQTIDQKRFAGRDICFSRDKEFDPSLAQDRFL
jgi:hypothetical protein